MPNQFAFGLDTINIILRLSNMKSNTIIFVLFVLVSGINAFSWHEQCRLGALQVRDRSLLTRFIRCRSALAAHYLRRIISFCD